jgi:hypothetical protein
VMPSPAGQCTPYAARLAASTRSTLDRRSAAVQRWLNAKL